MNDYEAMLRSLGATAPRGKQPARSGPPRAAGLAAWALALATGAACLAVHLSSPRPAVAQYRPAVTCAVHCPAGHGGGKLVTGYVLGRAARGLARVPFRAARLYFYGRLLSGPPVSWNLP